MKKPHIESLDVSNSGMLEGINELETQENNEPSIKSSDDETNMSRSEISVDFVFAYNVA